MSRESTQAAQSVFALLKSLQDSTQIEPGDVGQNSRFPFLSLVYLRILIPKPTFVARPRTQIPRLHQESLRRIDIALSLELLHSYFHAIFRKHHVLLLHLIRRGCGDLLHGEVDVIANECESEQYDQEDEEW